MLESKSGKWALYGDPDAQIIVCGHSHAGSILMASMQPELQAEIGNSISVCYSADWAAAPPGNADYWDFVVELSRGKHVVIVWNGNQHNADFMFETEPRFTILGALEQSLDQEAFLIPIAMIKDYFKPSFEELIEIIPSLSNAASITLMNGPAPKPLTHIQNCVWQEKYYIDIAKSLGVEIDSLVITSDSLRIELWNILAELLANSAKDLGANFLSAPAASRDAFGMLLQEYWASDVTHANSKYGMLLIEELQKLTGMVKS
jgi:hypothetical protein